MEEKAEILRNDQRANTFAGRAIAEADDVRGRWAEINKSNVVGSQQAVHYPRLPENSWTIDPTGVEPPLGLDVNAVEPCGEKFEIEELGGATTDFGQCASSGPGQTATASVSDPSASGAEALTAGPASPDVMSPRPPNPKLRRR
jgi:hypothetical protein